MKKAGLALLFVLILMCQFAMAEGIPSAEVGSYVTFGRYQQTMDEMDIAPVEWLVLDVQDGKALLISRYILDGRKYHLTDTAITWEECKLRAWLNDTFLNTTFTEEEQQCILTTLVDNSAAQGFGGYPTYGGGDTSDKVFLLSYAEAKQYFYDDDARACAATEYAIDRIGQAGVIVNTWWLRSPGYYQERAITISYDGGIYYQTISNSFNGGVRPAMWVSIAP